MLPHIVDYLPATFQTYFEPFLGGGSLFFLLQPDRAQLGDACSELMLTYGAVRDGVSHVLRLLHRFSPLDREQYYRVRSSPSNARYLRAAEFIFLNKACWNGLYRVNASGSFNVPYGKPKSNYLVDPENLRACSALLRRPRVSLATADFAETLRGADKGDLVFLDPPYALARSANGFVDYNESLFSWEDQVRLARVAERLRVRGCHVVALNADVPELRKLYAKFSLKRLQRHSTLSGDASRRRKVGEALFWSIETESGSQR